MDSKTNSINEQMFFLPAPQGALFVHAHYTQQNANGVFLLLNPFFDEKKRVQQFMAQTARAICQQGFHVFRFDYFGTGDSTGQSYEAEHNAMLQDLDTLVSYIMEQYPGTALHLAGIRLGADVAMQWAATHTAASLLLIEPVFNGARYLTEQRARRKMFHKINGMLADDQVAVNGLSYEDFQGYLMAPSQLRYIEGIQSLDTPLAGHHIFLYKVQHVFSNKQYTAFADKHGPANTLSRIDVPVPTFWDKLEMTDTTPLTQQIAETVSKLHHHYV